MRNELGVRSIGPGAPTVVCSPREAARRSVVSGRRAPHESSVVRERLSLLAVDDQPEELATLRRHLMRSAKWDLDIREATDAEEMLSELERGGVDAILLDYYLGGDEGLDVLARIQAVGFEGPVIILTGQQDTMVAVELMRRGAADYLPKAILGPASLERSIANALEKARLRCAVDQAGRELEATNEDLRRRHGEIRSFHQALSHELKTPLTAAREFIAIILDGLAGPLAEQQREYLGIALDSCNQMVRRIDDLLDATRLETGKLRLELASRDPGELLQRLVQALRPNAEARGVALELAAEEDLPAVPIDADRIAQVVQNLLSNALKFTHRGGVVRVRAERSPQRPGAVRITVRDNGRGIEAERLERVFEPLYQVAPEDWKLKGGLGIGLSICKQIVELHGGEIGVESTPGAGATFWFSLPGDDEEKRASSCD